MNEHYTDDDYRRLHRAYCHQETELAALREALEPFAKAARILEWTTKATGQTFADREPFQSGLAWRNRDGSTGTITYGDLRRARAPTTVQAGEGEP